MKRNSRVRNKTKISRIELAENGRIELLRTHVDNVLEAIGHPEALVTDESQVWNFTSDKNDLKRLSKKLGFGVSENDYIWELAERYSARK